MLSTALENDLSKLSKYVPCLGMYGILYAEHCFCVHTMSLYLGINLVRGGILYAKHCFCVHTMSWYLGINLVRGAIPGKNVC